jgi:amidase
VGPLTDDEAFAEVRAQAARLDAADHSFGARALRAMVQDHRSWFTAHVQRESVRAAWASFFQDYDVLLCPVHATAAFPHDQKTERRYRRVVVNGREQDYNATMFWAGIASLPFLPATSAPAGRTPAGLPVGVQIIGPYHQDHTTIEFARLLAQETEGFVPPPGYG